MLFKLDKKREKRKRKILLAIHRYPLFIFKELRIFIQLK